MKNEKNKHKWTGNYIGDSGATKISEALMTNNTLTTLDLSCDDKIERKWKRREKQKQVE